VSYNLLELDITLMLRNMILAAMKIIIIIIMIMIIYCYYYYVFLFHMQGR